MKSHLEAAGRVFVQSFVAALVVYGIGILSAPDLAHTYLIAVAAIIAAFAFGLAAAVNLLSHSPDHLSFARWLGHPVGDWLDAFAIGFFSTLIVTLPGVLGAPDFGTLRAIAVGVRAVVGALPPAERPNPAGGVNPPAASVG
jgi:hypothetical protein